MTFSMEVRRDWVLRSIQSRASSNAAVMTAVVRGRKSWWRLDEKVEMAKMTVDESMDAH